MSLRVFGQGKGIITKTGMNGNLLEISFMSRNSVPRSGGESGTRAALTFGDPEAYI
jgi:hypothetical protein